MLLLLPTTTTTCYTYVLLKISCRHGLLRICSTTVIVCPLVGFLKYIVYTLCLFSCITITDSTGINIMPFFSEFRIRKYFPQIRIRGSLIRAPYSGSGRIRILLKKMLSNKVVNNVYGSYLKKCCPIR